VDLIGSLLENRVFAEIGFSLYLACFRESRRKCRRPRDYRTQYTIPTIIFDSIRSTPYLSGLAPSGTRGLPDRNGREWKNRSKQARVNTNPGKAIQCVSIYARLRLTHLTPLYILTSTYFQTCSGSRMLSRPLAVWQRLSPDGKAGVLTQIPQILTILGDLGYRIYEFYKSGGPVCPQQSPFKTYLTFLNPSERDWSDKRKDKGKYRPDFDSRREDRREDED
jgi:hypothetical protein